jgi:hypothetical protein
LEINVRNITVKNKIIGGWFIIITHPNSQFGIVHSFSIHRLSSSEKCSNPFFSQSHPVFTEKQSHSQSPPSSNRNENRNRNENFREKKRIIHTFLPGFELTWTRARVPNIKTFSRTRWQHCRGSYRKISIYTVTFCVVGEFELFNFCLFVATYRCNLSRHNK